MAWRGVAWRGAAWLAWLCGLVCLTLLAGDVGEVLTQARTVTLTQTLTPQPCPLTLTLTLALI